MTIQELLSPMRRAINDFNMIEDGDKIAVGVSGGKDSLVLLTLLANFRRYFGINFELCGITIDMGFAESDYTPIADYCCVLEVPYYCEKTDIAEIIFDIRKEKNPCSLCAKMRRGALNAKINQMGYNKLALGHHKNDVVDTFLLSLFYEGRLNTFQPVSFMSRSGVTLIRPMIYIDERDIAGLAKTMPVCKSPCPADKNTQRQAMKDIKKQLSERFPDINDRIATAVTHPERYNLWISPKK